MKKVYSFLLIILMVFTFTVSSAFGMESPSNQEVVDIESIYNQASMFAEERGIELDPLYEGESIDIKETSHNSESDKIIKKESNNQLENVELLGGPTANNAQSIALNQWISDSISVNGEVDWFKFTTNSAGAYNIFTIGSTDTFGEIYSKNIFGNYELLSSNDDSGDSTNFRLEMGLSGSKTYYVKVRHFSSSGTGNYTLMAEPNTDVLLSSSGGSWSPTVDYPDPDTMYFSVDKIVYLPKEKAQGYYIMLSKSDFHKIRDKIISSTLNAAIAAVMQHYGVTQVVATFIVGEAVSWTFPTLTALELDSIAAAGNMQSDGTFSNGIRITSVTASSGGVPVFMNTYESWIGHGIVGATNYRGIFNTSDFKPLWR